MPVYTSIQITLVDAEGDDFFTWLALETTTGVPDETDLRNFVDAQFETHLAQVQYENLVNWLERKTSDWELQWTIIGSFRT